MFDNNFNAVKGGTAIVYRIEMKSLHTLFSGLDVLLERVMKERCEALSKRLAARMAGDLDEEQEWADRIDQLMKAQEILRKMVRSIQKVLAKLIANLKAMEMRRLHSSKRQSLGDLFVDGMAVTMPVPPTI